jgi:hypothetical protein
VIHEIKQAICSIAAKVAAGEVANVSHEIINAHGGAEAFVERACEKYKAICEKETNKALGRSTRHAEGFEQIAFDGMPDGALPTLVRATDQDTGETLILGVNKATFDQMKQEIKLERQDADDQINLGNFLDRRVTAKEKTINFLDERGCPGSWTLAKIKEEYGIHNAKP